MRHLIRKWYVVQELSKAIALHSEKETLDFHRAARIVVLTQGFFLGGDENHEGLVKKSLNGFWSLGRSASEAKMRRRMHEYNMVIDSCVNGPEKYITFTGAEDKNGKFLTTTPLAYDFLGWWALLEKILTTYKLSWTLIVIPLILVRFGPALGRWILELAHTIG